MTHHSSLISKLVSPLPTLLKTHLDVCWSEWVVGDEDQLNFEHEKYNISIRCQIKVAEVEK